MTYEIKPLPYMPCAYAGCASGAEVKVWTKTGWAQVCPGHYPNMEYVKRPAKSNSTVSDNRAAYENSFAYRRTLPGHISEALPERVPGEDDELEAA